MAGYDVFPAKLSARYTPLRVLGRGGMGVVFEAEDTELLRRVAVKVLMATGDRPGRLPEEMQRRFRSEAVALARIRHPGVVGIHDAGVDQGSPYLVMELLDGSDLPVLGAGRPLPVAAACQVAVQTLDALAAAHRSGVLHRDVKPGNIRVRRTGRVALYDFGLARLTERRASTALNDGVVGTPQYMAPERIQGLPSTEATDLYGVGACLHFMLIGRPPFASDPDEFGDLVLRVFEGMPSLAGRGLDLPDGLVAVVDALCAREPHDRPVGAAAAAEQLAPWAEGGGALLETLAAGPAAAPPPPAGPAAVPAPARAAPRRRAVTVEAPEYDWSQVDVPQREAADPHTAPPAGGPAPGPLALSEVTRRLVNSRMTERSALSRQREAVGLVLRGEPEEAAQLLSGVTGFCEEALGPDHPTTLACLYWQAVCQARLDRPKQALELFARVSAHHGQGRDTTDA